MRLLLCDQPWRRHRWLCRQPYRRVSRPTPGDVVEKHSSSTSNYTETDRLGSECQGSIHYDFINDCLFLVEGDSNADVRNHLRGGRSGIDDAVCEGRKPVRDGDHSFTYRMIRDRVFDSIFYWLFRGLAFHRNRAVGMHDRRCRRKIGKWGKTPNPLAPGRAWRALTNKTAVAE